MIIIIHSKIHRFSPSNFQPNVDNLNGLFQLFTSAIILLISAPTLFLVFILINIRQKMLGLDGMVLLSPNEEKDTENKSC